jgi:ubiquinone/menaquinone biosynthesis C-methylase UbiE
MRARLPLLLALCSACLVAPPGGLAEEKPKTQTQPAGHGHSHDATVNHPFDDIETWVGVFDDPTRDKWQKPDRIPAALGLTAGMVVADIGAGTGYFEKTFSTAVGPQGKVYAVDIEPKMVDHMKERAVREKTANVFPMLAAPGDPGLPDAGVDVIFICDTWHHINDRLGYLGRLARTLKPGGVVAIVDFQKRPLPVGPPPEHKMSREDVLAEFAEAGWVLARESDALPYQYFLMFKPPPR